MISSSLAAIAFGEELQNDHKNNLTDLPIILSNLTRIKPPRLSLFLSRAFGASNEANEPIILLGISLRLRPLVGTLLKAEHQSQVVTLLA